MCRVDFFLLNSSKKMGFLIVFFFGVGGLNIVVFWTFFFFFLFKGAWDYIKSAEKNFLESKLLNLIKFIYYIFFKNSKGPHGHALRKNGSEAAF